MARSKTGKANGKATAAVNGIGHNSGAEPTGPMTPQEMTDEQRQALFFQHKKKYEAALAKKKEADAQFKNACKLAKAEIGDDGVLAIKDAIKLETEEGEAEVRAAIDRQLRVARWMAVPLGSQADLFSDFKDRTPATERALAEGRRAGMEGLPKKPPYAPEVPQYAAWMDGWTAGQAAIFSIKASGDLLAAGVGAEEAA